MLRYANLTCDAVEGLAEQLGPTSLLNNTPPDETVTRALEGLKTLSQLMYELLGVDNPLEEGMTSFSGQWKGCIMSIRVFLS